MRSSFILGVAALLAAVPAVGSSAVEGPTDWDLRKVAVAASASSCEKKFPAESAFDGDAGSRWSSEWADDQWISIDLGDVRLVTEIGLQWESAYASEYALEASDDGRSWREIKRVSKGKEGEDVFRFDALAARWLRMRGFRRATAWGFSLREFVVRGPVAGIEPEFGGLVRPREIVTIFDHDSENLSRRFAEQCAQDPTNSSGLSDDAFLDLIEKRAFDFFWYEVHPETLFIVDSTSWKARTSNAGIGYQLGAYIAGHYRKYRPPEEIYARVERLLDHCWDNPDDPGDLHLQHEDGWTYHWTDITNGVWRGEEHICTHDSIAYLCGVIAAKHYFAGTRAGEIAGKILDSVNWAWIIHGGRNKKFVSNCYAYTYDPPCGGEVRFYDGMKFDYLLPIGGESSSVPPVYWHNYALDFPWDSYNGHFWRIQRPAQWIHQWDHVWFDFQYMKDDYADYHQNGVEALLANRQWCLDHRSYDAGLWGLNPCNGPSVGRGSHYGSYGAPPDDLPFQKGTDNDGTITPTATLPSIFFAPKEVIRVARTMYDRYKDRFWRRYGFPDALNPAKDWFDKEYIAIDEGPIVINIENYRSRLIYDYFGKEELVWNGLARAGFVGIVDNFDESEHSAPYGTWYSSDSSFKAERATDCVKEGKRSLQIRYGAKNAQGGFVAVRPGRKDFSPYRFLTFWVRRDPGVEPTLVMEGGKSVPLIEAARRPVAQEWSRRYFTLPDEVRMAAVDEVRFALTNAAAGTCWLDGIFLTHEIPSNEWDFVLDDFAGTRSQWSPDATYQVAIVSNAGPDGTDALRLDFAKTGKGDRWKAVSVEPPIRDWSRFHSVALWARGKSAVRLRLADGEGRSFDVGTYTPSAEAGWRHVFFNIQANLNPSNCWEVRYDKRDIREMQILAEPGRTDCRGTVYLDTIMLTE